MCGASGCVKIEKKGWGRGRVYRILKEYGEKGQKNNAEFEKDSFDMETDLFEWHSFH